MRPGDSGALEALEAGWWQRIREGLAGGELIRWSQAGFAGFLSLFDVIPLRGDDPSCSWMRDGAIYAGALPDMIRLHARRRTAHVLLTPLNENWGAFSTTVAHRTVDWGSWAEHLGDAGCAPDQVRDYLDDPAVKGVVATNHTVFAHPKIISLPLGIDDGEDILEAVREAGRPAKVRELLLNNSGWGHRRQINERVIANFGGRLENSYGLPRLAYFQAIAASRFVLCPSGMGWDTYRVWETLALGAIPVVESSAGWDTVLDDLPALVVGDFHQVTPLRLARAYPEILSGYRRFDYGKLTKPWWASRIKALVAG